MGGSFLRPSRDGVFRAGLQVFEIVEGLPLFIVYAILIGVAKGLHLDYIDRSEIQLEDRRGGAVRLLDGAHGIAGSKGGSGQQRQHHAAEQQDAEKSFSHGLVPPFSL